MSNYYCGKLREFLNTISDEINYLVDSTASDLEFRIEQSTDFKAIKSLVNDLNNIERDAKYIKDWFPIYDNGEIEYDKIEEFVEYCDNVRTFCEKVKEES